MFRKILFFMIFACMPGGYLNAQVQAGPDEVDYRFLSDLYSKADKLNLVIRKETVPVEIYLTKFVPSYDDLSLRSAKKHLRGISDETIADFNDKNSTSHRFSDKFDLPGNHWLVMFDDIHQLFPSNKDTYSSWKSFKKQFGGTNFYVRYSRVGFNIAEDQALLYSVYDSESGSDGTYVLYVKKNGNWKEERSFVVWRNGD